MQRSISTVTISEETIDITHLLEKELLESLRSSLPQAENASFTLAAKDSLGKLVGGLVASTSYGWLLIKSLWVDEAYQNQGLGRRLMAQAEQKAQAIGCHGAWLDTSSPDAMQFYKKLGYESFGQLSNVAGQQPVSHNRWFMKKAL